MVSNDQPTGADALRARRATQKYILEHEGLRQPSRSGATAGIDTETGWDYSQDGNPHRFTTDKKEIRRMAIEISQRYEQSGGNEAAVKELLDSYAVREDYKKQREAEQPGIAIAAEATATSEEDIIKMTESMGFVESEGTVRKEPEPEPSLPEEFAGIMWIAGGDILDMGKKPDNIPIMVWKAAQFQCLTRPDLDFTLPDDLPADVKPRCYKIALTVAIDKYVLAVYDKDSNIFYTESMPQDKYTLALKDVLDSNI